MWSPRVDDEPGVIVWFPSTAFKLQHPSSRHPGFHAGMVLGGLEIRGIPVRGNPNINTRPELQGSRANANELGFRQIYISCLPRDHTKAGTIILTFV